MLPISITTHLLSITTHLLSFFQRLLPYNTLRFALEKLDTYLLLYFLPVLYNFEGKGHLDLPTPPKNVVFILYNNIFPNTYVKISISSGIFHDLLTEI